VEDLRAISAQGAIAGADFPVLAVGYDVYWLIKRPSQGGIAPLLYFLSV